MKRSGFKVINYEEALAKRIAADEKRRNKPKSVAAKQWKKSSNQSQAEDAQLEAEWKSRVRERDDYRCQYPGCTVRDLHIDVHHLNPRSQRKDLLYIVSNGKCLCRQHHDWVPNNRTKAIEYDLLRERTYELAAKEGTLGKY